MAKRAAISPGPAPSLEKSNSETGKENGFEELQQRIRRLEDAVATLHDTTALEERLTQRVLSRATTRQAETFPEAPTRLSGGPRLPPSSTPEPIRRTGAESPHSMQSLPEELRRPWLLRELYAELRAMGRMFFDPRYQASWTARAVPLFLLAMILTSWIWLPGTTILPSFIATLLDKIIDLVLALVAIQILHREVRSYRQTVPDS